MLQKLFFIVIIILAFTFFINGLSYIDKIHKKSIDRQEQIIKSISYNEVTALCPKCNERTFKIIKIMTVRNGWIIMKVKCSNCKVVFIMRVGLSRKLIV